MRANPLLAVAASLLAFSWAGCSKRQQVKPMAETQAHPAASAPEGLAGSDSTALKHYTVKSGDCLWTIAGKDGVLGDSFRWPLLYKQNRDQISDPDVIEPDQSLAYQGSYPASEVDEAVAMAENRLPYRPRRSAPKY